VDGLVSSLAIESIAGENRLEAKRMLKIIDETGKNNLK
jgi:hypothetical protein